MARTSSKRLHSARFRYTVLRLIAIASILMIPACSARTNAPTAPRERNASPLSQRAGSSLCLILQDGILVDGLLVLWRAATPGTEAEIEQDYGLSTIDEAHGFRVSQSTDARFGGSLLELMRSDPRVGSAEPNFVADTPEMLGHSWAFDDGVLDGDGYEDQGAASRLGLAAAHEVSRGAGVLVAVLDTGVNGENPLLTGRVVPGWDFVDDDGDVTEAPDHYDSDADGLTDEALGHGTHVAGIVTLAAPEARILPIRVLDDDGRGSVFAIVRGIDYAVSRGARVLNLSLGMLARSELLQRAIDEAAAQGAVVIASAGNWGAEEPLEYPANCRNVIAVAATDLTDAPASFTSYGSYVGICAPGDGIRSSYWNGHTALWSGTSMSAGFASGGAALLIANHPEWVLSDVGSRLAQTSVPLTLTAGTYATLTAGRISLSSALALDVVAATPTTDPPPPPDGTTAPSDSTTAPPGSTSGTTSP